MRFMQKVLFLLLFACGLAPLTISAAVLENLYRVELTQSEGQSRDEVLREAAAVVLVRLAGNDLALDKGPAADALKTPQNLMRRIGSAEGGKVRVEFEPDALNKVLADAGKPALGRNRPGILVWSVEDAEFGDRYLSPASPWAQRLQEAAEHRGVAVGFPLGDLQDMGQLSEQLIRDASQEELLQASERYPAEGTLALSITGQEDEAQLSWKLWLNDQRKSGSVSGAADQTADELMQAVAAAVFDQYAIPATRTGDVSGWQLHVQGVDNMQAYANLLRMLHQLGSQEQPKLLSVRGDTLLLQVNFPGSEAQLERMLSLDMRLQRIAEPEPEPEPVFDATGEFGDGLSEPLSGMSGGDAATGISAPIALPEQAPTAPAMPTAAVPEMPILYFRWR